MDKSFMPRPKFRLSLARVTPTGELEADCKYCFEVPVGDEEQATLGEILAAGIKAMCFDKTDKLFTVIALINKLDWDTSQGTEALLSRLADAYANDWGAAHNFDECVKLVIDQDKLEEG